MNKASSLCVNLSINITPFDNKILKVAAFLSLMGANRIASWIVKKVVDKRLVIS